MARSGGSRCPRNVNRAARRNPGRIRSFGGDCDRASGDLTPCDREARQLHELDQLFDARFAARDQIGEPSDGAGCTGAVQNDPWKGGFGAKKTQSRCPSQETLRPWSAPTSRTRRPEKSAPQAKSGTAEFCPKRRRLCASRQSSPRVFAHEFRRIGSWQCSLVGLIGHLDREPRE